VLHLQLKNNWTRQKLSNPNIPVHFAPASFECDELSGLEENIHGFEILHLGVLAERGWDFYPKLSRFELTFEI